MEAPYSFLRNLLCLASPSGFEIPVQKYWANHIKQFADSVNMDHYGNCFASINSTGSPTIFLTGHADEIGLMVSYISDEGFIYFKAIGGIAPSLLRGQRVFIHHGSNPPVPGVIGLLAIHLEKIEQRNKVPELHKMYIDIGVSSKEAAEKLVRIGDPITLSSNFEELAEGRFIARGADNRIGIWAVAEALRNLAESRDKLKAHVVVISTIQEENGLYGASMLSLSHKIHPDIVIVVDVTHATDIPSCSKKEHGDVRLGHGPVLSIGSANHPLLNEKLCEIAKNNDIALQYEINPRFTGTDADALFLSHGGVPTTSIGVPNRYMHSSIEMIQFSDLESVAKLLANFCLNMDNTQKISFTNTFE